MVICPGDYAILPFEVLVEYGQEYYFSYASMVLPSNDAFIANGNPTANMVFDSFGKLTKVLIEDFGSDVLDAGTEVNDEFPANTAFFGQMTPDTGDDENGVVTLHPGFKAAGMGGILDDERFRNADFTEEGYQMLEIVVMERSSKGGSKGNSKKGSKGGHSRRKTRKLRGAK